MIIGLLFQRHILCHNLKTTFLIFLINTLALWQNVCQNVCQNVYPIVFGMEYNQLEGIWYYVLGKWP